MEPISAPNMACADEHPWRTLIENLPEIILTVDLDGRIQYINRTGTHLTREEVVGRYYWDFLEEADRAEAQRYLREVRCGSAPEYFESRSISPDGKPLGWYSARIGPLEREGRLEGIIIVSSNISERRRVEQALRDSQIQLKELTARQQCALEQERRRISRELHDELGQLLTALNIDLAWLGTRLQDPPIAERLSSMKQIVATTVEAVRRLTSTLRPPLLDDLGLAAAIDWLLGETCPRAGLKHRLTATIGDLTLPEECSLAMYRICQEALTNIVRHARARQVEVELGLREGRLWLRVRDDGIGIAPERLDRSLGILGIRERLEKLQGSLCIDTAPQKGTTIVAELPLAFEGT